MIYPILLDEVSYPHIHVVSLKRNFEVLDGPNAARSLQGNMIRDVIGTYYNYSVEIDGDSKYPSEYDAFYEAISAPVASHELRLPYGQSFIKFQAYVTNGKDDLANMSSQGNRWGNLSFNFIAMAPART